MKDVTPDAFVVQQLLKYFAMLSFRCFELVDSYTYARHSRSRSLHCRLLPAGEFLTPPRLKTAVQGALRGGVFPVIFAKKRVAVHAFESVRNLIKR